MYPLTSFIKSYTTYRPTDLLKIVKFDNKIQLPKNSIIHLLDNYGKNKDEEKDYPNLYEHPLVVNESFKKYLYHQKDFDITTTSPIIINDNKKLFLTTRLSSNLLQFRQEYKNYVIYLTEIESIPNLETTLTIINHNPLFRLKTLGQLAHLRRANLILASILNTCSKFTNKHHFIEIPINEEVYTRSQFVPSSKKIAINTVKYPDSYHYIFMMHFLNYINPKSTTSLFENIPSGMLDKITFVLTLKNKNAIFYTLNDLKTLNHRNEYYNKIVNHINLLAMSLSDSKKIDEIITKIDATSELEKEEKEDIVTVLTKKDQEYEDLKKNIVPDKTIKNKNDVNVDVTTKDGTKISISKDTNNKPSSTKDDTSTSTTTTASKKPKTKQEEIELAFDDRIETILLDSYNSLTNKLDKLSLTLLKPDINKGYNAPIVTKTEPDQELNKEISIKYMEELDTKASTFIENNKNLTPKQKAYFKALSVKYKECSLNNKNVESILLNSNDSTIEKSPDIENPGINPNVETLKDSTVMSFDSSYLNKTYEKDLINSFNAFSHVGVYLINIKESEIINEINRLKKYTLTYKDINNKTYTIHITIPLIDKNNQIFINGSLKTLKKQLVNLPICKISPYVVALTSSFNKARVEKNQAKAHSFLKYIKNLIDKVNITKRRIITKIDKFQYNEPLSYEYTMLAKRFGSLLLNYDTNEKILLSFDKVNRLELLGEQYKNSLTEYEKQHGILFGKSFTDKHVAYFINIDSIVTKVELPTNRAIEKTAIMYMINATVDGDKKLLKPLCEWIDLHILSKKIPIWFVLAYRYGLKNILNYLQVDYKIYDIKTRFTKKVTDIIIKFKDVNLVIPRYPLTTSFILSGLACFDLDEYTFESLNDQSVYYQLLVDKKISPNMLIGINDFFDFFIGAREYEILVKMNQPTNFRDLLIKAVALLTTEDFKEPSSMANFRIRSYERIADIVYNQLARSLAEHRTNKSVSSSFTINPNAIYQEIIQEQGLILVDSINPIQNIKEQTAVTYTGVGGRQAESFVTRDRIFPQDGTGILSEATPDNAKVGISSYTSVNPTIVDTRGFLKDVPPKDLQPENIVSVTTLLMPCATNDDQLIKM